MPESLPLSDELVAFLEGGRSLTVASRDRAFCPSLAKAVAARVVDDGCGVVLLLPRSQSAQLLRDIAACGQIAAVFSQPISHRTVQLKGSDALEIATSAEDWMLLEQQRGKVVAELAGLGYAAELIEAFLDCRADDLAAVRFTPSDAFSQTPGPRAGERLGAT